MKINLAVIGQGVVCPAGFGPEALTRLPPLPAQIASVGNPDQSWPVLPIDFKSAPLMRWQKEPRLRRCSPITLYLVEAAEQALAHATKADRTETGLIVAFSTGCLAYSCRFFEAIVTQGQRAASPALFPETVFNSPGSHVATVLGLNGAAYALVGDATAWVAALKTAAVWLIQKRVKQVLVLGAEEFDPIVLDAYGSAGWIGRKGKSSGFLSAEGAGALLVRTAQEGDALVINEAQDGFVYRKKSEVAPAAKRLFEKIDPNLPCYPTAGHTWLAGAEQTALANRAVVDNCAPYMGEASTASAAWQTCAALGHLTRDRPKLGLPIWGLNHQLGSLELEKRS